MGWLGHQPPHPITRTPCSVVARLVALQQSQQPCRHLGHPSPTLHVQLLVPPPPARFRQAGACLSCYYVHVRTLDLARPSLTARPGCPQLFWRQPGWWGVLFRMAGQGHRKGTRYSAGSQYDKSSLTKTRVCLELPEPTSPDTSNAPVQDLLPPYQTIGTDPGLQSTHTTTLFLIYLVSLLSVSSPKPQLHNPFLHPVSFSLTSVFTFHSSSFTLFFASWSHNIHARA